MLPEIGGVENGVGEKPGFEPVDLRPQPGKFLDELRLLHKLFMPAPALAGRIQQDAFFLPETGQLATSP